MEVCRLQGQAASRAALSASMPLIAGRLTLELAERAAARAGMSAKLQRIALAEIDAAALPTILVPKDNHACVLLGCSFENGSDTARVLLPETGQGSVALTRDELSARFTAIVLGVRPHFRFDKRTEGMSAAATPQSRHWFCGAMLQ